MDINKLITAIARVDKRLDTARQARLKAEDKEAGIKKEREELDSQLQILLNKEGTEIWKTPNGKKAEVKKRDFYNIREPKTFFQYVKDNSAFDCLQRRLNNKAIEDRIKEGERVPGVSKYTKRTVKVS